MSISVAAAAFALLIGVPSMAAACSCMRVVPKGESPRPWFDRPRIFVGHVLLVDGTFKRKVLFVTESSWRGPMADTVTLTVRAPCAHYIEGGRYLVLADVDDRGALVTAPCDDSWSMSVAPKMMAELGAPNWVPPPVGLRALDRTAVRLGSASEPERTADAVVFSVPWHGDIQRFEIANWTVEDPSLGRLRLLFLRPGLYQFRISWKDGTRYESYLWLRCDPTDVVQRPCHSFRFFGNLR